LSFSAEAKNEWTFTSVLHSAMLQAYSQGFSAKASYWSELPVSLLGLGEQALEYLLAYK
jgi:hypothetical protein